MTAINCIIFFAISAAICFAAALCVANEKGSKEADKNLKTLNERREETRGRLVK